MLKSGFSPRIAKDVAIDPSALPAVGFLDELDPELGHGNDTADFLAVGYGGQITYPPPDVVYFDTRWRAFLDGRKYDWSVLLYRAASADPAMLASLRNRPELKEAAALALKVPQRAVGTDVWVAGWAMAATKRRRRWELHPDRPLVAADSRAAAPVRAVDCARWASASVRLASPAWNSKSAFAVGPRLRSSAWRCAAPSCSADAVARGPSASPQDCARPTAADSSRRVADRPVLFEALRDIVQTLDRLDARYMLVGGVALAAWTPPLREARESSGAP